MVKKDFAPVVDSVPAVCYSWLSATTTRRTMTSQEYALDNSDFDLVTLPLNVYCARSDCQLLMHEGIAVKRYDAATFTHVTCPTLNLRNFSAHKQPDTGMRFG